MFNQSHRLRCRNVMQVAWGFRRSEPGRSFSDCLKSAWAWMRKIAVTAAAFAAQARTASRIDFSPSLIKSPIGNATRGQRHGRWLDHRAAYTTARLGY